MWFKNAENPLGHEELWAQSHTRGAAKVTYTIDIVRTFHTRVYVSAWPSCYGDGLVIRWSFTSQVRLRVEFFFFFFSSSTCAVCRPWFWSWFAHAFWRKMWDRGIWSGWNHLYSKQVSGAMRWLRVVCWNLYKYWDTCKRGLQILNTCMFIIKMCKISLIYDSTWLLHTIYHWNNDTKATFYSL